MKVAIFGCNELGGIVLESLVKSEHEVSLVVTNEDNDEWYSGIEKVVEKYNINMIKENNINSDEFIEKIKLSRVDCIVSANYNKIFKEKLFKCVKVALNIHASLLPKYRGRAPINWAMINGEQEVGVSVHYIEAGIDTGKIVIQEKILVNERYIDEILTEVREIYSWIVVKSLNMIESNTFKFIFQDDSKATYFPKRTRKDGEITLDMSTKRALRMIKALSKPYPGAFYKINGKEIIIWKGKIIEEIDYLEEGINNINEKIYLHMKDGTIIVEEYEIK